MSARDAGILRLITVITVGVYPCDTFISSANERTNGQAGTECLQVSESRPFPLLDFLVRGGVLLSLFITQGGRESQTNLDREEGK